MELENCWCTLSLYPMQQCGVAQQVVFEWWWPFYVIRWPQVLSQGFPSKMKTYYLQRFRDNLSSFQSLRWDHYWKLHVLPIISPPQWIDKQNHHWLFPIEQTIVICTVHSHLDLCRLIFQFAALYFTGYGPRFELIDVNMCVFMQCSCRVSCGWEVYRDSPPPFENFGVIIASRLQ